MTTAIAAAEIISLIEALIILRTTSMIATIMISAPRLTGTTP